MKLCKSLILTNKSLIFIQLSPIQMCVIIYPILYCVRKIQTNKIKNLMGSIDRV